MSERNFHSARGFLALNRTLRPIHPPTRPITTTLALFPRIPGGQTPDLPSSALAFLPVSRHFHLSALDRALDTTASFHGVGVGRSRSRSLYFIRLSDIVQSNPYRPSLGALCAAWSSCILSFRSFATVNPVRKKKKKGKKGRKKSPDTPPPAPRHGNRRDLNSRHGCGKRASTTPTRISRCLSLPGHRSLPSAVPLRLNRLLHVTRLGHRHELSRLPRKPVLPPIFRVLSIIPTVGHLRRFPPLEPECRQQGST